jgi:hypothetical protein
VLTVNQNQTNQERRYVDQAAPDIRPNRHFDPDRSKL